MTSHINNVSVHVRYKCVKSRLDPIAWRVVDFNLESAVEIVVRALKLMKVQVIFAKFFEAVLTRTVEKILQKSPVDSDD